MENVHDLVALGDEYEVTRVLKECHKFLMSSKFNDEVAVQILLLAQKYELQDLRTKCCKQLRCVELDRLTQMKGFQDLDGDSLRDVLIPQLKRAETSNKELKNCLQAVLPQLVGLLEFSIYLIAENKDMNCEIKRCPYHYNKAGKANAGIYKRAKSCTDCQAMIKSIPRLGIRQSYYPLYKYGHDLHFDEKIIELLPKLIEILQK